MLILTQFLLRAAFGLAVAMAITSPKKVTSGFFRNHSYVLLGMCVLAALAMFRLAATVRGVRGDDNLGDHWIVFVAWQAVGAAVLSYCSAAAWLYEKPQLGRASLALVALSIAIPALPLFFQLLRETRLDVITLDILRASDPITGGLLLGTTLAAMFLGHWYLNTPTMELAPLRRLVVLMLAAAAARAIVCGAGTVSVIWQYNTAAGGSLPPLPGWPFFALRWLAGIVGPLVLGVMAWKTLKIPNTQSATGILYVAVIVVFIGELTSLLLSAHAAFPL